MNLLRRLGSIYDKVEEIVLVVMLSSSLIILFINVILRYIFNSSIYGADELARVLFIWMSWLGISIGERRSEHIRIDMIVNMLHGVPHKVVRVIANLATLGILAVLIKYGLGVVSNFMTKGVTTPMYHIPQSIVYASLPYSCMVMAVRLIFNSIDIFRQKDEITVGGEIV